MEKILLIDDEADILTPAQRLLERRGYTVTAVRDGREGLEAALKDGPHLIITDFLVPTLNGYDLCKLLKGDEDTRDIPVIVMTAHPKTEDAFLFLGVKDFLVKPFDEAAVLKTVAALVK